MCQIRLGAIPRNDTAVNIEFDAILVDSSIDPNINPNAVPLTLDQIPKTFGGGSCYFIVAIEQSPPVGVFLSANVDLFAARNVVDQRHSVRRRDLGKFHLVLNSNWDPRYGLNVEFFLRRD